MTFKQFEQSTVCKGHAAKKNQFNLGFYSRCSFINDGQAFTGEGYGSTQAKADKHARQDAWEKRQGFLQ